MDTQGTPRSFSTGDVLGRPMIVTSFVILVRLLPDKTVSRHYTSGRSANKEPPGYNFMKFLGALILRFFVLISQQAVGEMKK